VTDDVDGHVQLLEVLFFLFCQFLASYINCLVHAFYSRQADDGTGHALVDPCERNMGHLPVALLCDLFHTLNDLLVIVLASSLELACLFFAL
jgi:hypothetical protein